jgi:hypothetical protein
MDVELGSRAMWVCLNNAFVSAVEASPGSDMLKVRARKREHLERLFPESEITESAGADYRFRVFVDKPEFAAMVANKALTIDYGNFKDSVKENGLHDLYANFWELHNRYQRRDTRL